ncbi:MAG: NAD(P)/FAD-dependent oxidoreductase [Pirellulales bacterium]
MRDVIIIGGGAAGLWSAGTAAARGLKVLVLEKNVKPGVKILMSGGSRCNITHHCDIEGIIEAFGKQGRFLKPALHNLSPDDVVREVNALGVATKVEETGKVFPVSDRALDVRDAIVRRLTAAGAELKTGVAVHDLNKDDESWIVKTESDEFRSRAVILCTGGLSYSGCGTTGDGYPWAAKFGHTIEPTHAALTPLLSPAVWVHELQGLTLSDVQVTASIPGVKIGKDPRHQSRSDLLWTHFGFSGPGAMNVSGAVAAYEEPHKTQLLIDLVPDMSAADCEKLFDAAGGNGRRSLQSVLHDLLPKRMLECLTLRAETSNDVKIAELAKKSRLSLLEGLKRLAVPLSGTRGYAKAEVTAGGVCRSEVNSQTLESRLVSGLFFAGEVLDIDGPIGGYNFQAAFATGHTAALNVCPT